MEQISENGGFRLTLSAVPSGLLFVAAFGTDNRMLAVAGISHELSNEEETFAFSQAPPNGSKLKVFLLDAKGTPLMKVVELIWQEPDGNKILVAYFSCTNTTRAEAEKIAQATGGELLAIIPETEYTSADLNYNTDCRANREQNDDSARPAISADCKVPDWSQYDVVFLGHPIWWWIPPKIMCTFCEQYDWTGKKVIGFCTSGESGYSNSGLPELTKGAEWLDTKRLNGVSQADVDVWIENLNLVKKEDDAVNKLNVTFNGHTYTATLSENSSADAFVSLLQKNGGSVTVSAHDYGNFEKVGDLPESLPRNDEFINTTAGDLILYQGNKVCLYYSTNSWTFTRLGKLDGDLSHLKDHLGNGDVSITYSLVNLVSKFDLASGENGKAPIVTLNSGCDMPVARIGTYSLTGQTCVDSIKSALSQGVRLIDTAYMYGNEKEVGQAVCEFMAETGTPREDIFVITKLYPGEQFSNPEKAIQDALDKLDIGYIDMMLLHHPGSNDVKVYKAMEKAVASGKIRSLELSNCYTEEIDGFISQVSIKPALVQNEIYPYHQEQKVIPYMHNLGIVMQAWYPLGGRGHQKELLADETLVSIAQAHGVSVAQVILCWDIQNGVVVILGSSNPAHIPENISLFDFELTNAEMDAIAALDRNEKHDWY